MDFLRTPDERFAGLRMHYLDEGPPDGEVVLLLHGEPSWSYLYRRMIPVLTRAGLRAVAIDLIGFGRSDKPTRREDYTYQAHVDWTWAAIEAIGLTDITLVCQDWGGLIGLRLVGEHPERFARVVAANTVLPTGDLDPGEAFLAWRQFSQESPDFPVGKIIGGACVGKLAPEVAAAYDAPFPDESFKAGARHFPMLVPTRPDDPASAANRAAWEVLRTFDKPFLCAFSDSDPITRAAEPLLRKQIPGAEGQTHVTITEAGHFLQEDKGVELAEAVVQFVAANPQ